VSAEEAFAKAAYPLYGGAGSTELFLPDNVVYDFANSHGFLNGAMLTDVMDAMASYGMPYQGTTYTDGPYQSVDYTNWDVLTSAIYQGPVKIGVAAGQLENVVGQSNGWFSGNFSNDQNIDHCTSLSGYGTVAECFAMLNVPVPSGADPGENALLFFTWRTIGVVTHKSLIAITGEAWLRTPTTPQTPLPPVPVPVPPTPTPTPPTPTPTPPTPTPVPVPSIVSQILRKIADDLDAGVPFEQIVLDVEAIIFGPPTPATRAAMKAIPWLMILQLLWTYGGPILSVILPILLTPGMGGYSIGQLLTWCESAAIAEATGQPLPPLPPPLNPPAP
jgi:hypothetical protein